MAAFGVAFLTGPSLPSVFAQQDENVILPAFEITMNDVKIDNDERLYPLIVYRDITYVPMTYNDNRFLGLETKWNADSGLEVNKIGAQLAYNPDKGSSNTHLERAALPEFGVRVNGKDINNKRETYPVLVFRGITYFPLTWRYMIDEFGWTSNFDSSNGLVINSNAGKTNSLTSIAGDKVFSKKFDSITVAFDRSVDNQPGNLYVEENNAIKRVGNPNYIYGVSYLPTGTYGEYSSVDKVKYSKRWINTLAINPAAVPITSKDVRINIDTDEVQVVDGSSISATSQISNPVYSKQLGKITGILDRSSNKQPGNLYVKEDNNIKRIGNPNYIYGVSYYKLGSFETYNPVDALEISGRWIYALAIDPTVSPLASKNVRVNIDTNEVQVRN
jgi:hypothetical protein